MASIIICFIVMDSSNLIIKTRDGKELVIKLDVILDMEDFMIKNMIEDTGDTSELELMKITLLLKILWIV